jgi:hypothetical protein
MQPGVMPQLAPDDLSAMLAALGGWRRISLPLIATTEEIHPHQSRRRRTRGRTAGRGDQSLSCRCDAALCARQEPERQRLTGWQSFVSSVTGIAGFVLGAIVVAAFSGPTQSS